MTSFHNIVTQGYCIGCGGCTAANAFQGKMFLDDSGMYKPSSTAQSEAAEDEILQICPFSNEGPNEDAISSELYAKNSQYNKDIGFFRDLYAGHATTDNYRKIGTSGGVITWLLAELISTDRVDYVVHIKASETGSALFEYGISSTVDEVKAGAKSKYYPVELSGVIKIIKQQPGRYAFVGLPCFIKSIRRLAKIDREIQERITYCVGLVCGHLKSTGFGDFYAWQLGVKPGELESIDFRVKLPDSPANSYGAEIVSREKRVVKPVSQLIGSNWGHNLFRNPACSYCDDVFAETADVCVGDAWLPQYTSDSQGTSIVVVRNEELSELIAQASVKKDLMLDTLSEVDMVKSQASGIRDRREGLAYRLFLKKERGIWAPTKRVKPSEEVSDNRKEVYKVREQSANECHAVWVEAKQKNDISIFISYFKQFNRRYERATLSFSQRVRRRAKAIVKRIVK